MDIIQIKKIKEDILLKAFQNLGYGPESKLDKNQVSTFLNNRASQGEFDPKLTESLFTQIGFKEDPYKEITVNSFINEYIKFDRAIRINAQEFEKAKEYDTVEYYKLDELIKKYEQDKLNKEGFSDESKITIKITDVDIHQKLQGIKSIIIKVIFNEIEKELEFTMGGQTTHLNKVMEFKRKSKNDYFEFIMKGIGQRNHSFDIGSKVFPLENKDEKEEYEVEILIPEIGDENTIVAHILCQIIINGTDLKEYERTKERKLRGLKKMYDASDKANDYVKKVKEIYGKLRIRLPSYTVNYNNNKEYDIEEGSYEVILNNERERIIRALTEELDCEVIFNNEMERITTLSPFTLHFNNTLKKILSPYEIDIYNERLSQSFSPDKEPRNTLNRSTQPTMNNTSPLKNTKPFAKATPFD